jgi:arylformamidase
MLVRAVPVVDLTHDLANDMPIMSGLKQPRFHDFATVSRDGYAMSEYTLFNHIGTHVDAPAHQVANGATLDEIPLDRLITEALTIDLRSAGPGPAGLAVLGPHLDDVKPGDFVFICSGNSSNWGSDEYWAGWSYPDAEASRALVARGVSGIGFDGPSADPVDTTSFALHLIWLEGGCLILENLANLELLPSRCRVVVAPMKVRGANGAPARVFAFMPDIS